MRLLVDLQSVNNVVGMHPKGGSILPHSLAPAEAVMLVFFFVLLDCFTVSVLHFLLEREVFWLSFLLPSLFADLCLEHLIGRGSPGQNLKTEHLMLDSLAVTEFNFFSVLIQALVLKKFDYLNSRLLLFPVTKSYITVSAGVFARLGGNIVYRGGLHMLDLLNHPLPLVI